jgi:GMP synthase-like glutamine amidotransferase
MQLLVIEHDHVSPLGPVAERFVDRGFEPVSHLVVPEESHHQPGVTTAFPDPAGYDAIVTMGARWSTYDQLVGSWVLPEIDLLRRADALGVPVLGICFGGQLLATAHGGSVEGSRAPEIGWTQVESDRPDVVPAGPWFQWHFDRWRLPPLAQELARNAAASQGFVLRRNLAVQFHPELTPAMLQGWLANGGDAMLRSRGMGVDDVVAATAAEGPAARLRAHRLVDGFLDVVATGDALPGDAPAVSRS